MSKEKPDLGTRKKALLDRAERSGERSPRLDAVKIPEGFRYLWDLFWELRRGLQAGLAGVSVTWRDMADYTAVTGIAFDPFEVEAIMAMDDAVAQVVGEDDYA